MAKLSPIVYFSDADKRDYLVAIKNIGGIFSAGTARILGEVSKRAVALVPIEGDHRALIEPGCFRTLCRERRCKNMQVITSTIAMGSCRFRWRSIPYISPRRGDTRSSVSGVGGVTHWLVARSSIRLS
jgi:hypothetical protein